MTKKQWFLIENEDDYQKATLRYEKIKQSAKGSLEYKEKLLLTYLINRYEEDIWDIPELDPVELIKVRMDDFGYKLKDLANEYGDKGTISKVLNYKQPLSLTMIRTFSKVLRIPSDALLKEYKLKS